MATLNDERFQTLGDLGHTGATVDRLLSYLRTNGAVAGTVTDAWAQCLALRGFHGRDAMADMLASEGYLGARSEAELAFWVAGGILPKVLP